MSTISGTLRVVGLKGGGVNLSVDLPEDADMSIVAPIVYSMAGQTVTLKRAEIEPTAAENPIDRLIRALRDASNAAIEVAAADPQENLGLTSEAPEDVPEAAQGWPVCVTLICPDRKLDGPCPYGAPCDAFTPAPPPDEPSIKHPDPKWPVCFTKCEIREGGDTPGSGLCTAEAPCDGHTLSEAEAHARAAAESEGEG